MKTPKDENTPETIYKTTSKLLKPTKKLLAGCKYETNNSKNDIDLHRIDSFLKKSPPKILILLKKIGSAKTNAKRYSKTIDCIFY